MKSRDLVPDTVKSSLKGIAVAFSLVYASNRQEALVVGLTHVCRRIPTACRTRVDVMREHVSAVPHVHPRIHVLEFVDVMHEHIVIAGMITAAIELLHIPRAHGCRCDEPRIRIVGNRIRRICAVHVDLDRRCIGDLVADVRCFLAVNPDLRLRPYTADRTTKRRSMLVRHVIRIEDGDVFALDIEAVRLHRAEVQHVARLCRRREGACAVP